MTGTVAGGAEAPDDRRQRGIAVAISTRSDASALSGLALSFVTAARGPEAEAVADDPFTLALKRYQASGTPEELGARWRHERAASAEGAPDLGLLRKLDRDLLSGVVRYATAPVNDPVEQSQDTAPETPARRTIGLAAGAVLPALSMGEDGRWHADDVPEIGTAAPRGRLAALAGLASRYPDAAAVAHARPLLDRIGPAAAASAVAARIKTVAPPPAFFPPTSADLQPLDAETEPGAIEDELLQSVSGGVELVVGPFTRLQHLALFTRAINEMPGIADVSARQFEQGMVHIRVHYSDDVPLVTRLVQLREFSPTVVSSTKTRIELKVQM